MYIISTSEQTTSYLGYKVQRLDATDTWVDVSNTPKYPSRIFVDKYGVPWVIDYLRNIWNLIGPQWIHQDGIATDIAISDATGSFYALDAYGDNVDLSGKIQERIFMNKAIQSTTLPDTLDAS